MGEKTETTPDEEKWTAELLQRKRYDLDRLRDKVIDQPSPENIDLLLKYAREYANVWCQHKAN